MTIENQVTNLELSRKLKELGVRQESLWYWQKQKSWFIHRYKPNREEVFSAFTVAELGEIWKRKNIDEPLPHIGVDGWYSYLGENEVKEKTEANARGKILIYLLENGLLKI